MEVLIAMMIVGLLGVAVVGGLVLVRATSDRTEAKAEMLRQLGDAATEVSLLPFAVCAPGTLYSSTSSLQPTIVVEVRTTAGTWIPCDGNNGTALATVQRVTLSTTWQGKKFDRMLMKAKS